MFNYLTPITYWILVAIWATILLLCVQRLRQRDFQQSFFTTALIVLAIEAARTLFESLFFGASHSSALGLIPRGIYDFLSHPGLIFIPKALNLIVAVAILVLLVRKLLPQETDQWQVSEDSVRRYEEQTTRQVETEKALRESENRFRNIVDATPMGIHMYELRDDGELVLTGANPAADSILGIDHSPLIGKTILEAFPALEYTEVPDRYRDTCILGRAWWTENIQYEDGSVSGAFEVNTYRTHPGGMVAQFLDITRRKQTEDELETLNRNLERLVEERTRDLRHKAAELEETNARVEEVTRLKSALLSTVTHELKTPLTSIIGYTKLTERDYARDIMPLVGGNTSLSHRAQRIKDNLDVIGKESAHLLGLIDNFLALSRIRSSAASGKTEPVSPKDIIKRGVGLSQSYFASRPGITLETTVDDDLPDIVGDPDNLVQMVVNLLDNATKFAEEGTVRLTCGMKDEKHIRIAVEDNGPGIPENPRKKVFEAFHQVCDDTDCTMKPPGIGTGLTICKHVAESHGGSIELECPSTGGCVFTVILPVETADERG